MNKLLLLLIIPLLSFGQITMIPDSNFEQRLISFGYDDILDGTVLTAAIDTVTQLEVSYYGISDLTGIQDFTDLTELFCAYNGLTSIDVTQNTALSFLHLAGNQLTSLNISQNTSLTQLWCDDNQLTSLDLTQNTSLTYLRCDWNQLTSLDVSQNTDLTYLYCGWNQLTSIDVSQSIDLTDLHCNDNQLTSLDIRNSNNTNMSSVQAINNLNLTCISVDDVQFSVFNWTNPFWFGFDSQHYFSNNCSETVSILDEPVPLSIRLKPNYPNPFNPITTLHYDLPEDAMVNITIYDMMGRIVSNLVSSQQNAGYKSIQWNATNNTGQPVSAGLYLYTIQAGDYSQTNKMVLLK